MTLKAKILEVFSSIQGEGPYAGVAQVFVRFFECNMRCVWCDTPYSRGDAGRMYQEFDVGELLKKVCAMDSYCHSVSMTGGEPLLQVDFLKRFCRRLRKEKRNVYLDTNGTLPQALEAVLDDIDIIAMDIKLPSSAKQRAYWPEHKKFLEIANRREVFVKVVVTAHTKPRDVLKAARIVADVDDGISFILQPAYSDIKNGVINGCLRHQKSCEKILKDVRILPQMHKFMKLR